MSPAKTPVGTTSASASAPIDRPAASLFVCRLFLVAIACFFSWSRDRPRDGSPRGRGEGLVGLALTPGGLGAALAGALGAGRRRLTGARGSGPTLALVVRLGLTHGRRRDRAGCDPGSRGGCAGVAVAAGATGLAVWGQAGVEEGARPAAHDRGPAGVLAGDPAHAVVAGGATVAAGAADLGRVGAAVPAGARGRAATRPAPGPAGGVDAGA